MHCVGASDAQGEFVSFANCGLPYFVGNVIQQESSLLVATPALFRNRFNIEVRTGSQVVSIDRQKKTVTIKEVRSRESALSWRCTEIGAGCHRKGVSRAL